MSTANGPAADCRSAAVDLIGRGFAPVPLPPRSKRPQLKGWERLRLTVADAERFADGNIGLLAGEPSGGLVDVDLDCPEAVRAAPHLLPPTGMISGRASAPASHFWYVVDDPPAKASTDFKDPCHRPADGNILLELRSTGGQTVCPPSIYPPDDEHPEPEPCVWHRHGDPARVDTCELRAAVGAVAAAALLGRYWPTGARNQAACALSGGLLRAGWPADRVERFITAVCAAARDDETANRVGTVAATAEALDEDKKATGWPRLAEILGTSGNAIVSAIWEWLGVRSDPRVTIRGVPSVVSHVTHAPRFTPLPPWVPFPVENLPGPVRAFAGSVAAAMRCDLTFAALPALAVCAGMVGTTRTVRLKRSWVEPAMIWAAVIGESSTLKSPAYRAALRPVLDIQRAHFAAHALAMETYRAEAREYERAKRRCKDEDPGDSPVEPPCVRIYSRDATVEALAGILLNNRTRMLVGRDELSGWLASFNQYKARGGSDQANWLELHNLGTLAVDRKTGDPKTIFVPEVGVSLCGGIQPGVMRSALTPDHFSAGIPARLLFAYPPRRPKVWTDDDIDEDVEQAYAGLVRRLTDLEPNHDDDGNPYPAALSLSSEARAEWVRFYNVFGRVQADADGDLAAAFGKLEAYAARLALLHHVCESVAAGGDGRGEVGVDSMRAGIALAGWFRHEAERVYQLLGEGTQEADTRRLLEKVTKLAARHGGRMTAKQLQHSDGRRFKTSESAAAAIETLVGAGLGRWEDTPPGPKGGRPTRAFVLQTPSDETDGTPDDDDHADPDPGPDGTDGTPSRPTKPPGGWGGGIDVSHDQTSSCVDTGLVSSVSSDGVCVENAGRGRVGGEVSSAHRVSSDTPDAAGYTLVADAAGVGVVVAAIEDGGGPVGLDLETTGLSHATDRVRLLSLATPKGTFLVDVFAVTDLTELFEVLRAVTLVGHNLGFDLPFLMRFGFTPGEVADTMLVSQVLHAGDRTVRHGLKDVAARGLGVELDKDLQAADWSRPLTPDHLRYAARDAETPVTLLKQMLPEAEAAGLMPTVVTEFAALPAVAWAARHGVGFDRPAWEALAGEAEAERDRLAGHLDTLAPGSAHLFGHAGRNWNSPEQVLAAFAAVGITLESTDDDALAGVDHPLAAVLREYRAAAKRAGTYGREWLRHVTGDRVYATWKQIGAGASGRMSCTEPNLQQLPRDLRYRKCFAAPPGRVLVKADYSQIELRIAAKVSGDARMLAAYRAGEDLHTLTAAAVLNKSVGEVSKADRQIAKSLNFGLLYGMGAAGLRQYARASYGVELTDEQAVEYRRTFFRTYPGLRRWHGTAGDAPRDTRTLAGRRRLNVARFTERLNTPVQGTGADGLKGALALLWERRAVCPGAFPVLVVHDEVVVECDAADADRAATWVRRAMLDGMGPLVDPVPVVVDVSAGPTWGG